ncbi:MAG: SCP2 sterol-binding domain-containing protein [Ectothiorhodospiraceae bacterium]|nr:SCP2 sterol-binding domain-containing protein [Ectothiorhodospiraceae bacterium]
MNHLPTAVTASIELALNRVLQLDQDTVARMGALQGKVIAIEFQGVEVALYLIPEQQKITVYGRYEGEADTVLRGTPVALMRMGLAKHAGDALFTGDVQISGDVELGQAFSEILNELDIDWEEHLSHITGDLVAHKVGNFVRDALAWGKQTADTLGLDVAEYLQEESDALPHRDEVEKYISQVDVIRTDVDRMEARVQRLESRSESLPSQTGEAG